jgi:hypothetical protein
MAALAKESSDVALTLKIRIPWIPPGWNGPRFTCLVGASNGHLDYS